MGLWNSEGELDQGTACTGAFEQSLSIIYQRSNSLLIMLPHRGVGVCTRVPGEDKERSWQKSVSLHCIWQEQRIFPFLLSDAISSLIMRKISFLTWSFHWIIFFSFLPTSHKCCKLPAWISLAWKAVTPCKHTLHHSALSKDCRYLYNGQSWKIPDRRVKPLVCQFAAGCSLSPPPHSASVTKLSLRPVKL